jgi:hypothetical protein
MKQLVGFQKDGGDLVAVVDFGFVAAGAFDGGGGRLVGFLGEGDPAFTQEGQYHYCPPKSTIPQDLMNLSTSYPPSFSTPSFSS